MAVGVAKPTVVVLLLLVAVKTELALPCKVKALPVLPMVKVALLAPMLKAPAAAASIAELETFKPLTAAAVRVPPEILPPLKVAPLIVPKPVIVGLLLPVTVPVMVGLVIVPLATLRPLTALDVKVPPDTLPPVKLPPEIVALLTVAPEVLIPPGSEVTMPLRPKVKPLALLPPMVIVPVVVVAVPTSIVMLPELELVPLALPLLILKADELVEGLAVAAVANSGACKPVAK